MHEITLFDVKQNLPKRKKDSHKGDYGKLFCICGSLGMAGAAILSAKAALRCGIGLINLAVPSSIYSIVSAQVPEATFTILDKNTDNNLNKILNKLNWATAVLIGCGLGSNEKTERILLEIIKNSKIPIVIDADGISIISTNINILKDTKANLTLTPHIGEMSRLINSNKLFKDKNLNNHEDQIAIAKSFAQNFNLTLVLKSHETIIATPDNVFVDKLGNPGMATAGSGDVLAGIIASFLAQGMSNENSAKCGVYLHSLAGDKCAEKLSQISMLASDITKELPYIFLNFIENN